jgi:excisionase family DNA binding protein
MARLMDINELAAYLKVEKQTVYNWLHLKKISGIKMGHIWRFKKKEIDEWLRDQRREAKPSKKGVKESG